jgi:hypothetical protein
MASHEDGDIMFFRNVTIYFRRYKPQDQPHLPKVLFTLNALPASWSALVKYIADKWDE